MEVTELLNGSENDCPTIFQVAASVLDKVEGEDSLLGSDDGVIDNSQEGLDTDLTHQDNVSTENPSGSSQDHINSEIISNGKANLKESLTISVKKDQNNTNFLGDLVVNNLGMSSNDSSCVNSPTFVNFNGSTESLTATNASLLVKEYEVLKRDYQILQSDYQSSLEREKDLCAKIQEHGGQDDESCNSLTNINNELRTELEHVLGELRKSRKENKSLQELVSSKGANTGSGLNQAEQIEDIVKLERIVAELENECKLAQEAKDNAKEKLAAHDMAAKRAITSLQKEMTLRVDQATKIHEDVYKEKDTLIVKVAKIEEIIDTHKRKNEVMEKKAIENKKEIERLKITLKQRDTDLTKSQALANEKADELRKYKEELAKQKDDDSGQVMKVKWAQNKLKQELETHKETKVKLAQTQAKIDESKEEGEQIRAACQEMIRKYQNSEEMRSNQLDVQLKERDSVIKIHEHEIAVQDEVHRMRTQELEALKAEHRKAMSEMSQFKTTVSMLEGKASNYAIRNNELEKRVTVLVRREEDANLTDKLLDGANEELKSYKEQITYYVELEDRLRTQLSDAETESKDFKQKETELFSFTEKLTENNARWKSQAFDMQSKADSLVVEVADLKNAMSSVDISKKSQEEKLRQKREEYENGIEDLVFQLEQKRKLVEQLTMSLEEAQDDVKVQKRKNTSTIKDLQRQLLQSKKRLDQLEECISNSQESLPIKSRTSSNSSLDRLSNDSGPHLSSSVPATASTGINNHASQPAAYTNYVDYSIVQPSRQARGHSGGEIEVDKAVLVDRICRLQKAHAKKNDKLDFMEEHISSLVEELKKKHRIVQYYVSREEAGTLASNKFDRNKAEMTKKGGIMASVYSSRVSDKDLTLDLSLEINRKLQAVLEDTILKNITLKESINTLGSEIARLQDDLKISKQ